MSSVSWQTVFENLNNPSYKIIDIREQNEFNESHIPRSINIPHMQLLNNFERFLSRKYIYYIICSKGKTSLDVVRIINSRGFLAFSVTGGYNYYKSLSNKV